MEVDLPLMQKASIADAVDEGVIRLADDKSAQPFLPELGKLRIGRDQLPQGARPRRE
jgi:hypothetical protein